MVLLAGAGQVMEDGQGVLKDGTRYIRESGEDFGANGFWKRWTRLAGVSAQGKVVILLMHASLPITLHLSSLLAHLH